MRRSDLRRLEAALARVTGEAVAEHDVADADHVVAALEAATGRLVERSERTEEVASRLAAALHMLVVGVVICNEHGEEVYRNLAAGTSGTRLNDVLAERAVIELLEAAREGRCAERSLELYAPVRRNLLIRAYPISSLGRPLGAVAVVEDVSERRRLDAIRRDFVANVSHELKTPVGALSLLAETLDGEEDPEVVARLSTRVAAEADRLGRIIDDLLDLSRIEANDRPVLQPVPVHQIVQDAVEPVLPAAVTRNIAVQVEPVPPHLTVNGDRRDLVSAVANLVDNAVKYSEPGSPVRVRVAATPEAVSIDVIDRGIGIPSRDRERIFERFYRVDRARSRLTGGTGLGLSIVRHVAANHGGEVRVASEEGEGSTFTLLLPAGAGANGSGAGGTGRQGGNGADG
ncbi:sensor histidine kinase [Acidimicrobiaceae bacterium USS-CC1]|uniref:Sensor-like histidine kinase SenX3 n=1 Tax=Acidiferrimicrobium australe TaxID=2664430 RepID=A0ABW9QW91_9ACTN|nr:sensor histidine kinase [Acidiferrimicrobium australe]